MLDTTGAGDAFTAGFLYQITQVGPEGRLRRGCSYTPDLDLTPGLTDINPSSLPALKTPGEPLMPWSKIPPPS